MPVDSPDPTALVFPNNICETLITYLSAVSVNINVLGVSTPYGIGQVIRRPLRLEDPDASLGIFPLDWVPIDLEIGDPGPAVSQYQVQIQFYSKHGDSEEGRRINSAISKAIRSVLYRNAALRVALGQMSETASDGSKERVQRFGVRRQRFAANELQGQFVHFSTCEFWCNTEISGGAFF